MSVQLIIYPQHFNGEFNAISTNPNEFLVNGINFNGLSTASSHDSAVTSLSTILASASPTIPNTWFRFRYIGSSTPALPTNTSGNLVLNSVASSPYITGVYQIASGRIDVAHDGDSTIMAAPGYGRAVMVRNLDDTNYVTIYDGASSATDPIGILEPGEFLFTIIRGTGTTTARANTAAVTIEYFAVEIDSAA